MKFKKMVKTQDLNFTVTTQFCVHVSALLIMWESVIHRCGLFFFYKTMSTASVSNQISSVIQVCVSVFPSVLFTDDFWCG